MISRRDIPGALLVLVFAAVAVADVGLQTTRLHAPVGRNITVLAQWNVTNSNSTDSLSSISVDLSHVGDGDALFCPESSEIRCDRTSTTKLDIAPSGASASLDSFQAALRSVLLFVGSLGTPQRSLSVTATAQSSAPVSKTEIVWAHPVLRFDGSAPATLSFPDGNRTTFVLPSVLVEYFDGFNLSAAVTIERGQQGDRLSTPPSSLPSASACSVSPSLLSLGPCSASEMQAKLRLLAFDSCFGSGALRSVVVSLAPSETPGDSSTLAQGIALLPVVPEFTVFRNGSEVVQYPVVATVGDIGPNSHVAVSLEYFLDHPGNVFCVAANRKDPFKEPTAYDLFNMAHDPQHNQPSRDYSSFGYGVIGATNATVRMMTGIQLGQDYAVFCCTAFDFVTLRGLSMNVTTRNATLPAARKSSDSSWTQTIIIVVCVVAGVICVERCYTSCRRVYRRRMGTEGFSEMPMVDSSAMDDDIDLSREVELAEREDRGRDGRPTADPDAWKTGNTFVSV